MSKQQTWSKFKITVLIKLDWGTFFLAWALLGVNNLFCPLSLKSVKPTVSGVYSVWPLLGAREKDEYTLIRSFEAS